MSDDIRDYEINNIRIDSIRPSISQHYTIRK